MRVDMPVLLNQLASINPAGPAPMIRTSVVDSFMMVYSYESAIFDSGSHAGFRSPEHDTVERKGFPFAETSQNSIFSCNNSISHVGCISLLVTIHAGGESSWSRKDHPVDLFSSHKERQLLQNLSFLECRIHIRQ
jgi:hypothetical protein